MKERIAVITVIILVIGLLLFVLIFSLNSKSSSSEGKNIILRSDIKEGYTINDMLSSVKSGNNDRNKYESEKNEAEKEEENLKRIQELIKENEGAFNDHYIPKDCVKVKQKVQIKSKPTARIVKVKQDTDTVIPGKRGFLSARLVKNDEANAIKAFVHSTQTVMVGSTLKMQLAENCLTDDGQRVRKGTPVYGEVEAIDGERVIVKITSINIDNNILPFHKNVYSRDAMEGIYVPGNPKSETAQDAGAAAVQGTNMNVTGGLDLGTQMAAGAVNSVVNAAKSATSKNIRKVKVTIKTNYQILLMEDKE